jgi:RNA polymerase sigma-70 factor (ECF subfamily)
MAIIKNKKLCFAQVAEGRKEAFDAFFEYYYPKLIQFALVYVNSIPQAEDVVADVLTNILIHRKRVFALEYFEAYLYTSVKNKALSSLKKNHRTVYKPPDFEEIIPKFKSVADPYELLVEKELRTCVHGIIQNLPPKRKMVYGLIREQNFTYRQVADLMEISERTVEVHLKLAIKALREGVEKYLDRKNVKKAVKILVKVLFPMFLFVL